MRELLLHLARLLLLVLMVVCLPVLWLAGLLTQLLKDKLDALDFALLQAGADRRTRNERRRK